MKLSRITPVVVKEFRQISRDRRTLAVLIAIPALLLVLYGYALNLDVRNIHMVVFDGDRTEASRNFIDAFFQSGGSEYFRMQGFVESPEAVDEAIMNNRAMVALIIPQGFAEDLRAGRNAPVQVIVDGVMASTAQIALTYVQGLFQTYSFELLLKQGASTRTMPLPIRYEPRIWYNPDLKSPFFLIPGLIAFIMMIITTMVTTLAIVREREMGSMEQLMVSPVRPLELIIGKLVPYAVIEAISAVLIILAANLVFGMPVRGSLGWLALVCSIYLLGALGLGLFISTIVQTQEVGFLLSTLVTMLPTFILSGFVFPISNMPAIIQAVTYVVPARYFLVALRDIMVKGVGPAAFYDQLLWLTGFAVLMLTLGTLRLRKILG